MPGGSVILLLTVGAKQVHADATNFGAAMDKKEVYEMLLLQARGILDGQRNWVCLNHLMNSQSCHKLTYYS